MTSIELSAQVGTRLLFEDQHIRVWLLDLGPGGASEWHRHERPYTYVVTHPGQTRTEYLDGTHEDQDDAVGEAVRRQPDSGHRLVNCGAAPYQNVIIEFLDQ